MAKKAVSNRRGKTESISCVWGLICSLSSIDQQKNNISLFNVIDQITVPKEAKEKAKQARQEKFLVRGEHEIVSLWRRMVAPELCSTEFTTDIKVSIVDSKGRVLSDLLTPLKFDAGKRNMRFRIQSAGYTLTEEGDYVYRIEMLQPESGTFVKAIEIPFFVQFK